MIDDFTNKINVQVKGQPRTVVTFISSELIFLARPISTYRANALESFRAARIRN